MHKPEFGGVARADAIMLYSGQPAPWRARYKRLVVFELRNSIRPPLLCNCHTGNTALDSSDEEGAHLPTENEMSGSCQVRSCPREIPRSPASALAVARLRPRGVWRVACGVWHVCGVCGVWSVECRVWCAECGVWSVVCGV